MFSRASRPPGLRRTPGTWRWPTGLFPFSEPERSEVDVFDFSLAADEVSALDALTTEEVRAEAQSRDPGSWELSRAFATMFPSGNPICFSSAQLRVPRPLGAAPQRNGCALGPRSAAREAVGAGGLAGVLCSRKTRRCILCVRSGGVGRCGSVWVFFS